MGKGRSRSIRGNSKNRSPFRHKHKSRTHHRRNHKNRSRDRYGLSWYQKDTVENRAAELAAYIRKNRHDRSAFGGTSYCQWLSGLAAGSTRFNGETNENIKKAAEKIIEGSSSCGGELEDKTAMLTVSQLASSDAQKVFSGDAGDRKRHILDKAKDTFNAQAKDAIQIISEYKQANQDLGRKNKAALEKFESIEKECKKNVSEAYNQYVIERNENIKHVQDLKNNEWKARRALNNALAKYNFVRKSLGAVPESPESFLNMVALREVLRTSEGGGGGGGGGSSS